MDMEALQIKKSLIDQEFEANKLEFIQENFVNVGCVSYEGVTVDVRRCPNHPNEFYIRVEGLGEVVHMLYLIVEGELSMKDFLTQAYTDFINYIVISRNEDTHDTVH